jgi:uracil-DNA glycosylase family 4
VLFRSREEVYICNTLRCRPPGNRTPKPTECENCREYLERQLELIRPKFICALGGPASQNLLGVHLPMGKMRGRFYSYKDIPVICTYHPAFLLPHRSPEKKKEVWDDMKALLTKMGRPIPPSGSNKLRSGLPTTTGRHSPRLQWAAPGEVRL